MNRITIVEAFIFATPIDITSTMIKGASITIQPRKFIETEPSALSENIIMIRLVSVPNRYAVNAVIPSAPNIHIKTFDTNEFDNTLVEF